MSTHISDDLPRLLTGDATREEVLAAAAHLRTCVDCQQELVSAVVAHASLTSAHRFAAEIATAGMQTPVSVDDLDLHLDAEAAPELPDLSAVFTQVRDEATRPSGSRTTSRRGGKYLVAAVAAGVLIGGGGAVAVTQLGGSSGPTGTAVALAAFGDGTRAAKARIGSGKLTLDASALPAPDAQHRYEVWLTNPARTKMQPVGWIGTNGKATLSMPSDLVKQFSAIEVSVQQVNAPSYDFSGTSVLRGNYSA
jgi:hypothetical protein